MFFLIFTICFLLARFIIPYSLPLENRILDEESFLNVLKEDQGRATNISLFDEIRLSFSNKSRLNFTDNNLCERCNMNNSLSTIATQTDEGFNECKPCVESDKVEITVASTETQTDVTFTTDCEPNSQKSMTTIETQTGDYKTSVEGNKVEISSITTQTSTDDVKLINMASQTIGSLLKPRVIRVVTRAQSKSFKNKNTVETQTEEIEPCFNKNKVYNDPCFECEKAHKYISQLENKIASCEVLLSEMENNFDHVQKVAEKTKNISLDSLVEKFIEKVENLEAACEAQSVVIDRIIPETSYATCQTEIGKLCCKRYLGILV